ncbi:ABC transporter ATP-binding protein [Actinopolymorpha rutila]|uniref:Sulfonate transport system ATP-binding protein n=1 Tax=Actinopolymorpha rutila TaxID=446787 RepID=A0A852Z5B5_9ACTN|nr:ABC transporter ATP-binding protein [Actinopolymorpha rutila]NYH88537.1 sulfonate transport system ATP-binding protein [Actinopolymorpha rutila]
MATYAGRLTEPAAAERQPANAGPAVDVRSLVRSFDERTVLDHLDLAIEPGEFVALLGRSGSGKSTLLRALAGLDHDVEGTGLVEVPRNVSVVFQDSRLLPWQRVLDNVTLGLSGPGTAGKGRESLAEVGLAGREQAWPNQLSGGEQQRVALARSLVREPELLLADEPFGSLDALTRIRMHGLLRRLCERHRPAVLLVTHDVDEAIALADRVLVLTDGRVDTEVEVTIDPPRDPSDPRFAELRSRLLAHLGIVNGGLQAAGPDSDVPSRRPEEVSR